MSLECKRRVLFVLAWILPAVTFGLDLNDVDKSLNPRLVGQIYKLYKPTVSSGKPPITVDCDHPGVICKFGSVPLVARPISECPCKGGVPIISGLTVTGDDKTSTVKPEGIVSPKPSDSDEVVPIYNGVVDADAILNEDESFPVWKFQRNPSRDKGWTPVGVRGDFYQQRVGELPRKFSSYYPFSRPDYVFDASDYDSNFEPRFPTPFFRPPFGPPGKPSSSPFAANKNNVQSQLKPATSSWRSTTRKAITTTVLLSTTPKPLIIDDKIAATKPEIILDSKEAKNEKEDTAKTKP